MNGWESFLIVEAGAAAVLAGLIFVGVSINLARILALPRLPSRALEALVLLFAVLVITSLLLVPGQPVHLIGIEMLMVGLVTWIAVIRLDVNIWRNTAAAYRGQFNWLIGVNQLAVLPYLIGASIILVSGLSGLYWLVPAIIFSFVKALLDAWVLLVEINR